jgi:site-specific DNA-methyltransferase (adenine-specific)
MKPFYADDLVTLLLGDCLEVMAGLGDASIDAIVTDPPYALGFMGKKWDSPGAFVERQAARENVWDRIGGNHNPVDALDQVRTRRVEGRRFQGWCEAWAAECLRLLRPGGYLAAFGATRTYHRLACGIEDAGFEVRDSLHWLYGSGFPKGKACLKPAHEPIVLARKPAPRMKPFPGLDACRVSHGDDLSRYDRSATSGFKDGGVYGNGSPTLTPAHDAGRWPPNILLSHLPECVPAGTRKVRNRSGSISADVSSGPVNAVYSDRERVAWQAHGDPDGLETVESTEGCAEGCPVRELDAQSGSARSSGIYDGNGSRNPGVHDTNFGGGHRPATMYGDSGGASRFFPCFRYQAKAPKSERPRLADGTAWPTVKPLELMRWLVRLVTPSGGTVLDLFAGTGTTGEACALEGFPCVLIERDRVAAKLSLERLRKPASPTLFG